MSETEKIAILDAVTTLNEKDKQFVLGYAMGVASKAAETNESKVSNDDHRRDQGE